MLGLNDRRKSVCLLAVCPISLALMGYAVKLNSHIPIALVLLARFGISAVVYSAWLGVKGFNFHTINPSKHLLRTVLGFTSIACLFGAITTIPLSTALCLSYTVPIFSYIISICIGSTKVDYRLLFVVGAIIAVVIIARPSSNINLVGVLLGLSSAFLGALALYEIKRISITEGSNAVLVMYFLYSTFALLLIVALDKSVDRLQYDNLNSVPTLLAVGLFGLLYQMSLVSSLKLVSVTIVSLALLTSVVFGYAIDIVALGVPIDATTLIGTLLLAVFIGSYIQSTEEEYLDS